MPENAYNSSTGPQDIPDDLKVPDGNVLRTFSTSLQLKINSKYCATDCQGF